MHPLSEGIEPPGPQQKHEFVFGLTSMVIGGVSSTAMLVRGIVKRLTMVSDGMPAPSMAEAMSSAEGFEAPHWVRT